MNFRRTTLFFASLILLLGILFQGFSISLWWLLIPIHIYLLILVLGAIYIQHNFYLKSRNNLTPHHEKQIMLTFDDGIHAEFTPIILDALKEKNVRAMFFLIGKNIPGNEGIVARMLNEGHTIGNHSYSHGMWFDLKSVRAMVSEILQTNGLLESISGMPVRYFRPPYGVTNPNVARAVRQSGLISVGWSLRSMDTVATSEVALLQKLKSGTFPGCIVLLHDRCEVTSKVLTDYIDYCKDQGYTFVTLNS
ncbi:MAG: polysaccharide deacetylase family protein [Chitinophagaceae bacterium]|nr:polysaccharide deacetylase family protein [Chitinophagaceae bacterium]